MSSPLRLTEWESKAALTAHLEACGSRRVLVGVDAEAPKKFYSLSLPSEAGPCEIGIVASFHGIEPGVIVLNEGRLAIIGLDQWVTAVDITTTTLVFRKYILGVFFEFIPLPVDDQVLVVHEIGALRLDANGIELWAVSTDIVDEFFLDGQGHLVLTEWDGGAKIFVNVDTGVVSSGSGVALPK
jgi:hypothetical protein